MKYISTSYKGAVLVACWPRRRHWGASSAVVPAGPRGAGCRSAGAADPGGPPEPCRGHPPGLGNPGEGVETSLFKRLKARGVRYSERFFESICGGRMRG